ncbi:phage terminase large subunit [Gammaproteobacteria bacterium]
MFTEKVMVDDYVADWKKGTLEVVLINASLIQFFGIDNFERKASMEFDVILVEESTELEEEDHVMLQGRLRGTVAPLPMKIDVCNPGAPGSYLHKTYVEKNGHADQDKDFAYFQTNSYENVHNPKSFFDRLKKWIGTQYYARYVLGQWKAFRGSVYETYDPAVHICAPFEIPDYWEKFVGIDFGLDMETDGNNLFVRVVRLFHGNLWRGAPTRQSQQQVAVFLLGAVIDRGNSLLEDEGRN